MVTPASRSIAIPSENFKRKVFLKKVTGSKGYCWEITKDKKVRNKFKKKKIQCSQKKLPLNLSLKDEIGHTFKFLLVLGLQSVEDVDEQVA